MGIARVPGADRESVVSDSAVDWTCGRRAGSHVMRARLAVLALAGLIAVLGVTAISVSGAGHEAEVRIAAQRLADGRTEFALQQREADGGWSERLLTRERFFPATPTVGRWLSSTPLTVRSLGAGDDAEGTVVRIAAQRLADGRTEFALQEREADGQCCERWLPRGRFFPATVAVGRWLSSTPLTVSLPEVPPDTTDGGSVASDRAALVALYHATGGASWTDSTNWLSDRPIGEWYGVTTSSDGRVAELVLYNNQLTGRIPAELGDLTKLEGLYLSGNELTECLPAGLRDVTVPHLTEFDLPDCREVVPDTAEDGGSVGSDRAALVAFYNATGGASWTDSTNWLSYRPIGEWYGVTTSSDGRVAGLVLDNNELTGPIPAELGALTNLVSLDVRSNQLTGTIPGGLGELTNLEWLVLHNNQLTGPIPAELGSLSRLEQLWLSNNQLIGSIPGELGALTNLESLSLSNNQLTGPIPAELGALTNLQTLTLGHNQLTWSIPAELGGLTKLEGLWLGSNELTGRIPAELGDLTNLGWLGLSDNELTGPIPPGLGALSNLQKLYLGDNQLTGPIPGWLADLTNLELLGLQRNQLTGPIPAELGTLTNLQHVAFSNNQLTGPIPAWLGDLTNLQTLWLAGNELTGCVPAGLRDVATNDLGALDLPDCGEVAPDTAADGGSVASDRAALVALYSATGGASWIARTNWLSDRPLDEWHGASTNSGGRVARLELFNNQLTGSIPAELGDLTNLQMLNLDNNQLTGSIPTELGDLTNLEVLGLYNNQLTGSIPAELGGLSNLERLWLSGNELTGCVPAGLRDVASNDLGELGLPDCG